MCEMSSATTVLKYITVLSTLGKTFFFFFFLFLFFFFFFCLTFCLTWNYFVLIDYISSETICRICFCDLFSNTCHKIKFIAKNRSDLCNFYNKMIFWKFLSKKIFFTFLCWIWIIDVSQQYCENFRKKNEQTELVENLPPSYLPYKFLHNLHSFLLWEKVKLFDFSKPID